MGELLIGGQFRPAASGDTFASINPTTGEQAGQVARAGAEDVDTAVAAARAAFEGTWRDASPLARQKVLQRLAGLIEENAEELALLDTVDVGVPIARSRGNVLGAANAMLAYAAGARTVRGSTIENSVSRDMFSYTLKEPVGVVGAIIPWNNPVNTMIGKIGPALAAGCTVVLKPAEQSPLSAVRVAELCVEAGIPDGVVNVLTGFGDAGAALSAHPGVDKISFTGSVETGQAIIRASAGNMKRLTLELGGKSPDIVFADADLDAAVAGAAMGAYLLSGQFCAAGTRLFVERKVYDEFLARVVEYGRALEVGDPTDESTVLGPLVSSEQLAKVLSFIDTGVAEGARLLSGGSRDPGPGYFLPPTVFGEVGAAMTIAREEIFGPVLAAMPFDDIDEVLPAANATRYGLAAGVWTSDVTKVHWLAPRLESGMVWVNTYGNYDKAVPFGGYKMSGLGVENGAEGLEQYLKSKCVWINAARPIAFR
ncbi:aldehyde dehydrogenase family protein [Phytohabitans flavus]|uniref:aldehyde dehydrogenase family protein n=1 Tax=Phytohabitans flavus TaxID=1076124 RepID=UPI001E34FB9A|nr:aldehyde dehydrogenase family protein [Phytohabitans flavus]